MSDNRLEIHVFLHSQDQAGVVRQLSQIQTTLGEIQMTEAEQQALLDKVDVTTTKIGANLDTVAKAQAGEAAVVQAISDEMDKLLAAGPSSGVSAQAAAKLQNLADRLQTSSDNSDKIAAAIEAQVPVLTAIAAKGAPVVPPPPPPPVITPTPPAPPATPGA